MRRLSTRHALVALTGLSAALLAAGLAPTATAATVAGSAADPLRIPAQPGSNVVTYGGTAPFNNGQAGLVYGQLGIDDPSEGCKPGMPTLNDQHKVTIAVPPSYAAGTDSLVEFRINWTPNTTAMLDDLALHVFAPDGSEVGSSDGSTPSEAVTLTDVKPGVYDVLVCAFQTEPQGQAYTGTITARTTGAPKTSVAKGVKAPTYKQFSAPKDVATGAGEPSVGNNWKTGHTVFTSNTDEYDVAFNDAKGTSTWTAVNVGAPNGGNAISLDPIGFTDSAAGRSFISQLLVVCSGSVYSDDDFQSSTPSEGCGTGVNGGDHQTLGAGPFPKGMSPLPTIQGGYKNAVYYCAQSPGLVGGDVGGVTGSATCARSDDGGLTFGTPNAVYHAQCGGLHGHVRVGPEGYVYLPNKDCGGQQGVAVSKDGGATFTVQKIPGGSASDSDPSVAAGKDGTVYEGWSDGTGRALVSVAKAGGTGWSTPIDVGAPYNVLNSEFAEVTAGDGDRAAFAFLGTPTKGTTQPDSFGKSKDGKTFTGGAWHLYVATTYDRGRSWTTVDATPTDPVQRGCIWNSGGSNPCRNLLDFNDITLTKQGRVMVGLSDGCVGPAIEDGNNCAASNLVSANGLVSHGAIVRQTSGLGLFAAFDPKGTVIVKGTTPSTSTPSTGAGSGSATPNGGSLPTTGGAPLVAGAGLLLVAAGVLLRRRRA